MEDGEETKERFHNRNSKRTQEHFNLSVDNKHSNFDAFFESQNLKIESSSSISTSKSVRIFSGLSQEPRLHGILKTFDSKHLINPPIITKKREPKNEILSRTLIIKNLLKIFFYFLVMWLMCNALFHQVESAVVKTTETSLSNLNKDLINNRTFRNHGRELWGAGLRPKKQKKSVNKNCKEYDITSRAFLADLIFEGTARSRSRRSSGRYVTFVIEKILKQKNNLLRPKSQIRLHFGGKINRKLARVNPLKDCPLNSITSGTRAQAMANVRIGENYYVFADHFGPMNYTVRGEPIVVNRRNLKSIRSVLSRNKEKPPRVLGLKNMTLRMNQPLRLNCQIRGRPVPRINWYKDGTLLIPSSRVNVTYYRRNSTVEIKSVELKDKGLYECRATSITGKMAKISAHVNIWQDYTPPSTKGPEKSFHIKKCSVDAYCLNGGKCYFIENLGEHMCECVTGFKGPRCEIKEVSVIDSRQPMEWPEQESQSSP